MGKLGQDFYIRNDVVQVAQDLLGKILYTRITGKNTAGRVVETEAYSGRNDRACHAHLQRRTSRTEVMFGKGGVAYVYLCYGIHHLFNVVTNEEDNADAVLIRALEPVEGMEDMMVRRNIHTVGKRLTGGPGMLTRAMGIHTADSGVLLTGNRIWFESNGDHLPAERIASTTRVGVDYAGEDASKPWRFYIKENPWISRP